MNQHTKLYCDSILEALHEALVSAADPEQALRMAAYMKHRFNFFGLSKPQRAALQKPFLRELRKLGFSEIDMLQYGWQRVEREWQYIALDYALQRSKHQGADWPELMEYCITHKSWWDSVDALAAHGVSDWLLLQPDRYALCIDKWRKSEDLWLQRTCLIHQLFYREETDVQLLYDLCLQFKDSQAFFIQKAMGWALRQFARTDAAAVVDFTQSNALPNLTKREALKHL